MAGTPDWFSRGLAHIWLPYTQMKTAAPPLPVVATEETTLTLANGRTLVDGVASWWTAVHGYNHPAIRAAVSAQLARLPHVMLGGLVHEQALTLARRLADLLPGDLERVFFSESGSVSVEIALKIAVQYGLNRKERARTRFLSFRGGYHGDTFATMAVCDPDDGMHTLFGRVMPGQTVVDLPDTEERAQALRELVNREGESFAAVLLEPLVQGAGGMRMHEPLVVRRIAEAARAAGALLIFDEIFTGFGRTGTLFACEQAGVVPDVITLSKALTGGTLPLAATVVRGPVFEAFWSDDPAAALMHGPTYTGNALACAAANASLDLFETEPRLAQARAIEQALRAALEPARLIPGVADVRVRGAIGAIELDHQPDLAWLKTQFIAEGVWLRPFGRTLYTTPALTIAPSALERILQALLTVTQAWADERHRRGPRSSLSPQSEQIG